MPNNLLSCAYVTLVLSQTKRQTLMTLKLLLRGEHGHNINSRHLLRNDGLGTEVFGEIVENYL